MKEKKIKIDKEFEGLFPRMTKEKFAQLKLDIMNYRGLREPIEITPDGFIIDGYNRYFALKELKKLEWVRTKIKDFVGNRGAIINYIHGKNAIRRNLNDFQQTEEALRYEELIKKYPPIGGKVVKKKSIAKIAKEKGISKRTFERAKKVIEEGSEEIKELCRREALEINTAYRIVKAFKDIPEKSKKTLIKQLVKGEINPQEIITAIASTQAVKEQLEGEEEEVREKAEAFFKDKYYTKELDIKEAIWKLEEIAGDPHGKIKREFPLEKFKDVEEAQAWAIERNGTCLGTVEKWMIEFDPIKDKQIRKEKESK